MYDMKRWQSVAAPALRVLAVLVLAFTGMIGAATPISAQSGETGEMSIWAGGCENNNYPCIGAEFTVTTTDGTYIGSCTLVGDPNNRTVIQHCQVTVPLWTTVVVTQDISAISPNTAPVENPIYFETGDGRTIASHWGVSFQNEPISGSTTTSGVSSIAIVTTENGQPFLDACFVLVDYSNEGCDANRDGDITFQDIPFGTYTLRQTVDLGSGRYVADSTITVTGASDADGWERFYVSVVGSTGGSSPSGSVDIALITRDPNTGRLITDVCYVLVNYSNVGCDENNDGQVTFAEIPFGTYTVRQTQTPAGYQTINDYAINVDSNFGEPLGFLVRQAPEQNAPNTRNASVVFIDSRTDSRIVTDICAQFIGASLVGCDEDLRDGQIDFLDVPAGTWELNFSNIPAGWQVLTGGTTPTVTIDASPGAPTHQMIFVQVHVPDSTGTTLPNVGVGALSVVGGSHTHNTGSEPVSPDTTPAGPVVEIILDTSGSMNNRDQGNQTRLDVAKNVTSRLVTETLPPGVSLALRTYSGCSSYLTIPLQPLDPNSASATINGLRASGNTPIAQSLRAAAADLEHVSGQKIVVLITDGEETCGGNPLEAIQALVAQDVTVQVNIVGFAIDDAQVTATFQEWARVGNGTYYQASNELELEQAVTSASQLSYQVIDHTGSVVAQGTVDGAAVQVPTGTYTVVVNTAPATRYENVVITVEQTTVIDLATNGVTGSGGEIVPASDQAISPDPPGIPNSGQATLLMTFRGCPEGFNPNTDDFYANCSVPLDAPDASFLYHGGDGQGGRNIMWMDRQYSGAYVFQAGPGLMNVQISGLAPVVRDGYTVIGADSANGEQFTINLVDGETREVWVFYYYWP